MIRYTFSRFPLDASKGVALLASQAFTHSYGENQRYVRLKVSPARFLLQPFPFCNALSSALPRPSSQT